MNGLEVVITDKNIQKIGGFETTKDIKLNDGSFIKKGTDFLIHGTSDGKYEAHFCIEDGNKYKNEYGDDYWFKRDEIKNFSIPSESGKDNYFKHVENEVGKECNFYEEYYSEKFETKKLTERYIRKEFEANQDGKDFINIDKYIQFEREETKKIEALSNLIKNTDFVKVENNLGKALISKVDNEHESCRVTYFDNEFKNVVGNSKYVNFNDAAKNLIEKDFKIVDTYTLKEGYAYSENEKSIYEYKDVNVLKNKFDIKDSNLLEKFERGFSGARMIQLEEKPIPGNFDLKHLCKIHNHIFKDTYDWAGKIRNEDIIKGDTYFANCKYVSEGLNETVFKPLKKENYLKGMNANESSERLAHYYCELNFAHPFREGNGRTQREFVRELASKNGFSLDWNKVDSKELMKTTISATMSNDIKNGVDKLSKLILNCFDSIEPNKSMIKDMKNFFDIGRDR